MVEYSNNKWIAGYACVVAESGKRVLVWTAAPEKKAVIEGFISNINPELLSSGKIQVECATGNLRGKEYEFAILEETVPMTQEQIDQLNEKALVF